MSLALLIASLVATAIQTLPGLPSKIGTILGSVSATLGVIIKNGIGSGTPVTVTVVLATLQGVIAELKTVPGLNQTVLDDIAILETALQAALTADAAAAVKVDPTLLQPITPVP